MKKIETKSTVLLKHHLKQLKMSTMERDCEEIAFRCAKENVDHLALFLQRDCSNYRNGNWRIGKRGRRSVD